MFRLPKEKDKNRYEKSGTAADVEQNRRILKMKETKKNRLRADRVLLAMGIIVGTLFGADGIRRSLTSQQPYDLVIKGKFRNTAETVQTSVGSTLSFTTEDEASTEFEGIQYLGYSEFDLSKEDVSCGVLAVYDESAPANEAAQKNMIKLDDVKNEFYSLADEDIRLNEEAAEALGRLMEDYANETGLADFLVYGTTDTYTGEGSYCPKAFPDSKAGYCVDLALVAYGSVIGYDGYDAEGWVGENCWKYGFIVRYPADKAEKTGNGYCPWHLRYVGEIHSAIMNKKNLCLEEYVALLGNYSFEEPYSFVFNGADYQIYSAKDGGAGLTTRIPISGNYELSGDNRDTFIITALKN